MKRLIMVCLGFATLSVPARAADLLERECAAYCTASAHPGAPSGAEIIDLRGSALYSTGAGYSPAALGARLGSGDRVVVDDGQVELRLNGSCHVHLQPHTVYTVADTGGQLCAVLAPVDPPTGGIPPAVLIAGGVVGVGTGVGILISQGGDPGNPVSP